MGQRVVGKSPYLLLRFSINLTLLLKNRVCFFCKSLATITSALAKGKGCIPNACQITSLIGMTFCFMTDVDNPLGWDRVPDLREG